MSKKQNELRILNNIYKEPFVAKIQESEQPDFIIIGDNEKFGVEITEYYYNESSARIKNCNGYLENIINSSDNLKWDKRDRELIEKQFLYILDSKNDKYVPFMKIAGIKYNEKYRFNEIPNFKDVEQQIIEIIKSKSEKAEEYKLLDYYELFIEDEELFFSTHLTELKESEILKKIILESKYKRVYIFSGVCMCIIGNNAYENIEKYHWKEE